jgi:uncharacterized membrane protein
LNYVNTAFKNAQAQAEVDINTVWQKYITKINIFTQPSNVLVCNENIKIKNNNKILIKYIDGNNTYWVDIIKYNKTSNNTHELPIFNYPTDAKQLYSGTYDKKNLSVNLNINNDLNITFKLKE